MSAATRIGGAFSNRKMRTSSARAGLPAPPSKMQLRKSNELGAGELMSAERQWSRNRLDINVGDKFGQWEVVREAEPNSRGGRRFLCRCGCGTERAVFVGSLRNGQSRSCGCVAKHSRLPLTEVNWRFG